MYKGNCENYKNIKKYIKSNKIIIIKTEEGHQQTPGTAIGLEKLVENKII